jgi:uncharacterized membrane protein
LKAAFFCYTPEKDRSKNVREVKGVVTEKCNSELKQAGVASIGYQKLKVLITSGIFKGQTVEATNRVLGQLEIDEFYDVGDRMLLALQLSDSNEIVNVKPINIFRQNWEFILFLVFAAILIIYARFIGLKALLSFVASLFIIWKFFIPSLLTWSNPLMLTCLVLTVLTCMIIFSVAGFNIKSIVASSSTLIGLGISILLTIMFGNQFELYGFTSPFAETLLFSVNSTLDLKLIFYSAVIIGASGATMDIAMDVAAAMYEIKIKRPDISMKELMNSGFSVGRLVIGTMTTTLLLAYSGTYLTMLMLFVAKDSSFLRILNYKVVAAEIFRVLIGSICLTLVAPIVAVIGAFLFSRIKLKH